MANEKKQPVHRVRYGRISAAIWENQTEKGVRHNVTVTRSYKPENEDWKDSNSFGREDLLLVAKVVNEAHSWIFQNGSSNSAESNGDGEDAPY